MITADCLKKEQVSAAFMIPIASANLGLFGKVDSQLTLGCEVEDNKSTSDISLRHLPGSSVAALSPRPTSVVAGRGSTRSSASGKRRSGGGGGGGAKKREGEGAQVQHWPEERLVGVVRGSVRNRDGVARRSVCFPSSDGSVWG